ncbi:MAG: protein kinase, partial [Planctomycetes bacterium]|nr:protein kinase [Planctomycetota bacterium]
MAGRSVFGRRRYEQLLAEFDEALAAGGSEAPDVLTPPIEDPDLVRRLDQGKACLRRLERVWPRGGSTAGSAPSTGVDGPQDPAADEGDSSRILPEDFADFRIVREIGRGGMGVVYEAEQISLGRRVALKVVSAGALFDKRQRQRFQNESRAAAALDHPHIVKIHAVGRERGVPYYAMQLIAGRSLAEWIDHWRIARRQDGSAGGSRGAEFYRRAARLGIQACEALEHAHGQGVVHRDVKPANLLVDGADRLYVADFGLARVGTDPGLTATGDMLGTLRYMSPEQASGKRLVDHRTDIYSLGAALYETVALEPLFSETSGEALLHAIAHESPRAPRRLAPNLPRDLETIILKATAKDPGERYATAHQMADDLGRFLEQKPIRARRPSLIDLGVKWMRRNGVPLIASLTAAALVLAGALFLVWDQRQQAVESANRANRLAEEMREHLYVADMKLADQAWWGKDPRRATDILRRHLPTQGQRDLRCFAWHCLWRQSRREPVVVPASDEPLYFVAYSRDGSRIAVAGKDAVVRAYDSQTYEQVFALETGQTEVNCVAFSPDDRTLATTGDDGTLRLWDVNSQREKLNIKAHPGKAYGVVFSHDGRALFTCGEDPVAHMWSTASGLLLKSYTDDDETLEAIALSPDGRHLAAGKDALGNGRGATVWTVADGSIPWKSDYSDSVSSVAFSPDGTLLAAGTSASILRIRHWATGAGVCDFPRVDPILSVCFAADGTVVFASDRGGGVGVNAFDPRSRFDAVIHGQEGDRPPYWKAHEGRAYAVALSPQGDRLASVGSDGALKTWPVNATEFVKRLADGKKVTGFAPGTPAAETVFVADGEVHEMKEDDSFSPLFPTAKSAVAVASSFDGALIAVSDKDGDVVIYERSGRKEIARRAFASSVGSPCDMAFSPTSATLAVAPYAQGIPVELLDARTGRTVASFPSAGALFAPAFSPDGNLLAISSQNDVLIYQVAPRKPPLELRGHTATIRSLKFSPDGRSLLSVSKDRGVRLWDAASGRLVWSQVEHAGFVHDAQKEYAEACGTL